MERQRGGCSWNGKGLGVGCWVLGVGCWVLGIGYWVLGVVVHKRPGDSDWELKGSMAFREKDALQLVDVR